MIFFNYQFSVVTYPVRFAISGIEVLPFTKCAALEIDDQITRESVTTEKQVIQGFYRVH